MTINCSNTLAQFRGFREGGRMKADLVLTFTGGETYPTGGISFDPTEKLGWGTILQTDHISVLNGSTIGNAVNGRWDTATQKLLLYDQDKAGSTDVATTEVANGTVLDGWQIQMIVVGEATR